jgi:hypothetical protein
MDNKPSEGNSHSDIDEKPKVHYNDNVGPAPSYHGRNDSTDMFQSRASSVAGTDDEYDDDEDYDWSGEEDLVDEEAKFEERMGVKPKKKGWGPKR